MEKKLPFIYWMVFIIITTIFLSAIGYNIFLTSSDYIFPLVSSLNVKSKVEKSQSLEKERKAVLTLSSQKKNYEVGQTFPVKIFLNTMDAEIDGADIFIKYDSGAMEVLEEGNNFLQIGNIFKNIAGKEINKESGLIKFSILSEPKETFHGQGEIAAINFKALKKGAANISFIFIPGSTADCNVSRKGIDVLLAAINNTYIIE
ncbi:MAG: hypothetical protein Athens101410_312 [Parcubacteria group bacterium Athens1014_10]|nr:MAG: hypothetical protein Athens101410_312 [Parcubacteria group bacterium Athens1014_10]TSD05970.1 MAG: hypothetical protein Athens071412_117 [Parcubacteria group bacterium Athens0714_12]